MSDTLPRTLAVVDEAAFDAGDLYVEQRIAEAIQDERMSVNVTIATRERSAWRTMHGEAIIACLEVARQRYTARKMGEANGALACLEAVRALLPEVA